jgi:hypothetical protein
MLAFIDIENLSSKQDPSNGQKTHRLAQGQSAISAQTSSKGIDEVAWN